MEVFKSDTEDEVMAERKKQVSDMFDTKSVKEKVVERWRGRWKGKDEQEGKEKKTKSKLKGTNCRRLFGNLQVA